MRTDEVEKLIFEANVCGCWSDINHTKLIKNVYTTFKNINWENTFFILNYDFWNENKVPKKFDRYVISFHYQYVDLRPIIKLASDNPDSQILLICDHMDDCDIGSIQENITVASWVTWHHQLNQWIASIGANKDFQKKRKYKISCLNGRYEIHKLVVVSAIYNQINSDERLISWHANNPHDTYDQAADYFIPDEMKEIINKADLKNKKIIIDQDIQGYQINWNLPFYVDCYVNVTTESVFNDFSQMGDQTFKLPGPMLTEKTWKPILGGCCFLPVAQKRTVDKLIKYGFSFAFINDIGFDCFYEYDRLSAIIKMIDFFANTEIDQLHRLCLPVAEYNLNVLKNGTFTDRCETMNVENFDQIAQWARMTRG